METINLKESDYYTQRNNGIRPLSACMPTARVMFYIGNKIPYTIPVSVKAAVFYKWDDDYFMYMLNTQEAYDRCYQLSSWIKTNNENTKNRKITPNEDHFMYPNYLDKLVCGKQVSRFAMDFTFERVLTTIDAGKVIMTTGTFPQANIKGHAFCIIGRRDETLILADPYGDFHTNYTSEKGYGVTMTKEEYAEHVLGEYQTLPNLKYAHIPI